MRVTILGCGTSSGVPLIGCDCPVCTSKNSKNNRTRVSVLVETEGKNLLIDTSPDLRQQALRENIRRIDAVLYTHDHADHINGMDDMRSFNWLSKDTIPVFGNSHTINSLKTRFGYAFQPKPEGLWSRPSLTPNLIPDGKRAEFEALGIKIIAFEQIHGSGMSLGFRVGDFAYSTDTSELEDSAFEALAGVDVWVVDCLKFTPTYNHSHLDKTLGWIERVKPKLAILTHMSHEFDYEALSSQLPSGVVVGYDGLCVEI
ncbi:MAG: MBL fold metallo-hydrolase [Alphaproteobacteria bacterium]|nr:MBL fold metallo-hydrolase [Alphaproteobacteria bacterium]